MSLLLRVVEDDKMLTVNSILCSDYAIRRIDEPFVKKEEDLTDWAL